MRFLIVLLLLISVAVILMMIKTNGDLNYQLEQQRQEIAASSKYIELLTEQLVNNGQNSHEKISDSDKMSDLLSDYLKDNSESVTNMVKDEDKQKTFNPDLVPIRGEYYVSQRFKLNHRAIDLASALGTQVIAAATGEVVRVEQDKYFGNLLALDHFNGYVTVYAHLAKILVEEGNIIKKGAIVGLVGNTGNSTGPHLHFEIIKDGIQRDPEEYLDL